MNTLPIAETAEKAALSLIACDPACFHQLNWEPSYFFQNASRIVFDAISMVIQRTNACDTTAVISQLETSGKIDLVGGHAGAIEILTTMILPPGKQCVDICDDYRRQLIKAKGYRDACEILSNSDRDVRNMKADLIELSTAIAKCAENEEIEVKNVKQHLLELITDLEKKTPSETFSTGLSSLDKHFSGGLHRGEMLVVGAKTSGGKSILLYQAALEALRADKSVVIFSLEMPAKAILTRMASNFIGKRVVPVNQIGKFTDMAKIASPVELMKAMQWLMNSKLTIVDYLSEVGEIIAQATRLATSKQADLVVVDYLQIVSMPSADNREQAVSELSRRLKLSALANNYCVMTASQLNDQGQLRESRAIGMHSDAVVTINSDNQEESNIRVDKNRRGARDVSCKVKMRGEISRFEEPAGTPF